MNMILKTEAANLLRDIISGARTVTGNTTPPNPQFLSGDISFTTEDYRFTVFFDGNDLDYLDSIEDKNGRRGDADTWNENGIWSNPIDLFTDAEIKVLEEKLRAALVI